MLGMPATSALSVVIEISKPYKRWECSRQRQMFILLMVLHNL